MQLTVVYSNEELVNPSQLSQITRNTRQREKMDTFTSEDHKTNEKVILYQTHNSNERNKKKATTQNTLKEYNSNAIGNTANIGKRCQLALSNVQTHQQLYQRKWDDGKGSPVARCKVP